MIAFVQSTPMPRSPPLNHFDFRLNLSTTKENFSNRFSFPHLRSHSPRLRTFPEPPKSSSRRATEEKITLI